MERFLYFIVLRHNNVVIVDLTASFQITVLFLSFSGLKVL